MAAPSLLDPLGGRAGRRPALGALRDNRWKGELITNAGYDKASANAVLTGGQADLVAFGVPYLANPDLDARFRADTPLNPPDPATFYGGGEKGYTDYPAMAGAA
jgi:N-ethylmaleimide reductase